MAKKGSKFITYSSELKSIVVNDYLSGNSGGYGAIAKKHNLRSKYIVRDWVKRYHEDPDGFMFERRGKGSSGRPKSIKLEDITIEEQNKYLRMENDILKKLAALLKQYGEH